MSYTIQPNIECENCMKCGTRPVIDQIKKGWSVRCPNNACKNSVEDLLVNIDAWNRLNKKNPTLKEKDDLRSAS